MASTDTPRTRYVSTREAAFIGVGAMVGAGIFSLLGTAGEVAGAAVWLSFLLAGGIAALQGYSFAKLGARYPTAGGLLEYVNQGFGIGHIADDHRVAHVRGERHRHRHGRGLLRQLRERMPSPMATRSWIKAFAVAAGRRHDRRSTSPARTLVARVQSLIVFVVVGILAFFAIVTIANIDPRCSRPSDYPSARDIVSSVALTFFAFLGFGVVTFTAKDLPDPSRQLPRAMTIAIGLATVIYVAVSLGVFGTLGGATGHRGRADRDRGGRPTRPRRRWATG